MGGRRRSWRVHQIGAASCRHRTTAGYRTLAETRAGLATAAGGLRQRGGVVWSQTARGTGSAGAPAMEACQLFYKEQLVGSSLIRDCAP
jgi:hypothetical protein